jgi:hypothetical protein
MTLPTTPVLWLTTAFTVGFFAVGLPYWQIPYAKVSLPDTLYGFGLLVVGISAFALRLLAQARGAAVMFVVGGSVPAAVLARVIVETSIDSTSHNLWPLESSSPRSSAWQAPSSEHASEAWHGSFSNNLGNDLDFLP